MMTQCGRRLEKTKQRDKPCSQCGCECGGGMASLVSPRSSGLGCVRTHGLVTPTGPGAPSLKVSRLGTPVNSKGASTSVPSSNFSIDVTRSLQSWITDRNITVYTPFPENLRCIISGPSESGKTVLLKNLFIPGIQVDRSYIIGPTGKTYNDLEYRDTVFIKDVKELPHPDKLPKNIKKVMIFHDVIAKEPIINEYFCRAENEKCKMIYLKQNIFAADRQNVRENCNLFIFFEQTGKAVTAIYYEPFTGSQLSL